MTEQSGENNHFPRSYRLISANDYKQVFKKPSKVSSPALLFLFNVNNKASSRLGLAIAKKQLPLAVDRNRIKRLIRESFREKHSLLASIDIVVLARNKCLNMDNKGIRIHLDQMWNKVIKKGKIL